MINKKDLKLGYTIYGAKGNVWNNTAHIYQSGKGIKSVLTPHI